MRRSATASDRVAVHFIPMNGHALNTRNITQSRLAHKANPSEPGVTRHVRARKRLDASGAKSEQRAAPRART